MYTQTQYSKAATLQVVDGAGVGCQKAYHRCPQCTQLGKAVWSEPVENFPVPDNMPGLMVEHLRMYVGMHQ